MSDYHGEIMNIPVDPERAIYVYTAQALAYKTGHRDARHAAAEQIGIAADRRIAELEAQVAAAEGMAAALTALEKWFSGESGPMFRMWEDGDIGRYEYDDGGDIEWEQTLANVRDESIPAEALGCDGSYDEVGLYRQLREMLAAWDAAKGNQ